MAPFSGIQGGETMAVREFTHVEIGREIQSISGYYKVDKEIRLDLGGREVLGIIANAEWDRSCCGMGGCRYAIVPGTIVGYKTKTNEKGQSVSEVETVNDEEMQKEIKRLIEADEFVQQVNFL
jgi:hypothetical protein